MNIGKFRKYVFIAMFCMLFTCFWNVEVKAALSEEDVTIVAENLVFEDGYGMIMGNGPNFEATAKTIIDDNVIRLFNEKGLYLVTYKKGQDWCLGVQDDPSNVDPANVTPITLKDEEGNDIDIKSIFNSYNDSSQRGSIAHYTEWDKSVPVHVLTVDNDKDYGFMADGYALTDTSYLFVGNLSGTDTRPGKKQPANVHQWVPTETTITIKKEDCTEVNGKYRYYFTVDASGTWYVSEGWNIFKNDGRQAHSVVASYGYTDNEDRTESGTIENKILVVGETYYIEFTEEEVNNEVNITYKQLHNGQEVDNMMLPSDDENVQEKPLFEVIEEMMSSLVLSIAKTLNWMISATLGQTVTMDTIIFNEYEEVNVNFFEDSTGSFAGTMSKLKDSINKCYSLFRDIALVGYLVILVYIGIKILLNSTTPDKKASYKSTFWYWVSGIIILFFFPYVMEHAITLNEAFVTEIADMGGVNRLYRQPAELNPELNKGFLYTDFDNVIDYSTGQDYMSRVGAIATSTMKLGYAIAYLVMTWQLIMMLVYYYKRLFIVAFLIIVFPLIAFTFVWDKLNDGKSQALSAWMKEYFISIFVQTFHAIVYVFICKTIYATLDTNAIDFILLIIVSSFMFTGEDILKQIFGGGGTVALGSVAQTGAKIALTTNLVTRVGKRVIHNVAGKDGFVRGNATSFARTVKYSYMLGKTKDGRSRFEKLADNPTMKARVATLLPSQGPVTKNIQATAEMVDTFNHLDSKSPEDVAKALKSYERLMKARSGLGPNAMTELEKKQFDEIMKHCSIGPHQIDGLNKAMFAATVAYGANNNAKKEIATIRQNLRVEVEQVFNVKDKDGKVNSRNEAIANKMLNAALINARNNGISGTTRKDVAKAYEDKVQETRDLYDNIKFVTKNRGTKNEMMIVRQRREARVEELTQKFVEANGGKKLSARQMAKVKASAKNFAILEGLDKKEVSAHEAANAMQGLGRNREIDEAMLRLSKVKGDVSQLEYLLAKKIKSENPGPDGRQFRHSANKNYGGKKFKGKTPKNKADGNTATKLDANAWADRTVRIYEEKAAGRDKREHYSELAGERMGAAGFREYSTSERVYETATESRRTENVDPIKYASGTENTSNHTFYSNTDTEVSGGEGAFKSEAETRTASRDSGRGARRKTVTEEAIEKNPYFSILDIIGGAQKVSRTGGIANINDMLDNASRSDVVVDVVDNKMDVVRTQNQDNLIKSQEFADRTIKKEGFEMSRLRKAFREQVRGIKSPEYEEPTYNGYTEKEIRQLRRAEIANMNTRTASVFTDFAIAPTATVVGAAIGAALTNDGMPIEEGIAGALSGATFSEQFSDGLVPKLTGQEARTKTQNSIEKKVKNRLKNDESARLKARDAMNEEADKNKDIVAKTLAISIATADLYLDVNNQLAANVHVIAENAQYVYISEVPVMPSSGWLPYQENVNYEFKDNDTKKTHTLFIYVRDDSSNIRSTRISNLRFN